jgi:glycosyltransferase involved in cell wall biosynthesis
MLRREQKKPMKILTIHNKYLNRGGEDESRESEDKLLEANGHEVRHLLFENTTIHSRNLLRVGLECSWSRSSYHLVQAAIQDWRPDIVDIHNFFPLASPAVWYAAKDLGVPVVQTLHNYRLLCPGGAFVREGRVCEDCTRHLVPFPGVLHGCYQGSALHTGAVALMITLHRALRSAHRAVSLFIVLSEFEKQKFVENGFPESRLFVKPNFVADSGSRGREGKDFLFAGRLSPEKGIEVLLRAMETEGDLPHLNIIGDGPLLGEVEEAARRNPRIRYLGRRSHAEVLEFMANSSCVIVPSTCYETFGRVVAEAFSRGTPVILSRIGALAEIADHQRTGLFFRPGDAQDLASVLKYASANPEELIQMGKNARREYEDKFTAARNLRLLLSAYEIAKSNQQSDKSAASSIFQRRRVARSEQG